MNDSMRDLYQEVIMDHNRNPRNFGSLEGANHRADGQNPLCGDEVTVHLLIEDGSVREVRFEGHGCAISKSSSSLMTQTVKGKTVADAERLIDHFLRLVTREGGEPDETVLGKLKVFQGVGEFPARVKCATLAWRTLESAMRGDGGTVSTE